ncbi:MAG: phosphotransferase family protein [Alphaproteobacteria bacterium]|nr:phosphotransferase family protein [Alphaproteobacteria bacterium]
MGLGDPGSFENLAGFLREQAGAEHVDIVRHERLSGGAIQENHGIDVAITGGPMAGVHALVLRSDAPSGLAESLSRAQEFRIIEVAHAAGVTVPEPLWLCEDTALIGRVFYVMKRVPGIAAAHRVVRDDAVAGNRDGLAAECGAALAQIHRIVPDDTRLQFLALPSPSPALAGVARFRRYLDMLDQPHPGFEWGLRWLERNAPEPDEIVLAHHDFRTGNLMIEDGHLTGVLDWEFACWSEPHEDIGWLCARCWRFGAWRLEAGGIADRAPFYRAYEAASGRTVDPARVYYWEVFAHMRWGILALHQGERHLSGGEPSLHLALTGRMAAEMEFEMIKMTSPSGRVPT